MHKIHKNLPLHLSLLISMALACDSKSATESDKAADVQEIVKADNTAKKPATTAPEEPSTAAIGSLDRGFITGIREHSKVEKIEIEIAADGVIRELALYHMDAGKIPESVRKRAEASYPGAKITGFESEVEGPPRRQVYEVELETAEGQKCEIEAGEDGVQIYSECEVDLAKLSEELKAAAAKTLPEGTIKEAEVVQQGDDAPAKTIIEVEVGESTHKLVFVGDQLKRHVLEIKAEIELDLPLP
ncbi:MAG TPA: hypothetical protein ENK31_08305 [Nannocystis exedens]|nr:hypothetical protein [Nannocystis exedens]